MGSAGRRNNVQRGLASESSASARREPDEVGVVLRPIFFSFSSLLFLPCLRPALAPHKPETFAVWKTPLSFSG